MDDTPITVASDDRAEALMLMVLVATEEWEREEGYSRAEIADALVRAASVLHGKPL